MNGGAQARTMRIAIRLLITAAATAALAAGTVTAAAAEPELEHASVTGAARVDYISPDDDVRMSLAAYGEFDMTSGSPFSTRAWGTVRISHYFAEPDVTVWAVGEVDCVSTGGPSATVSAIIRETSPESPDWNGKRVGLSVLSGEPSRIGFTGPMPTAELPPCMAPAASMTTLEGGYEVWRG